MSKQDFIERMGRPFSFIARATGYDPGIFMAQSALESGWGSSVLALYAKNIFGLKFHTCFWVGKKVEDHVSYEYEDGEIKPVPSDFAVFNSWEECTLAYVYRIRTADRYRRAYDVRSLAFDYFNALFMAGYATDPEYVKKCMCVYNSLPIDWQM